MLKLLTLGGLDLTAGVRRLDDTMRQPKRLALLAAITVTPNSRITRQQLLTLFWPEIEESKGRHALNQALYGLRNALGDGVIENVGRHSVRVNPCHLTCDATEFESLLGQDRIGEALERYHGPFLNGFYLDRHPGFAHWVDEQRTKLENQAQEACWEAADKATRADDRERVLHWVRRAVDVGPIDERSGRRAMEMLCKAGDPLAALEVFATVERTLRDELDLAPSAGLREFAADIRTELTKRHDVGPVSTTSSATAGLSSHTRSISRAKWLLPSAAVLAVAVVGSTLDKRRTAEPREIMAWSLMLPDTAPLALPSLVGGALNISHDGSIIAYVAEVAGGTQLYTRSIDSFDAKPVPNTRGAEAPFFSPQDDWLGFWADGEIRKTPVGGGPVFSVTAAPLVAHGVWLETNDIVFSDYLSLQVVPATGGTPDTISFGGTPSTDSIWTAGYWPSPLPGDTVLLVSGSSAYGNIGLLSLASRRVTPLGVRGGAARFTPAGFLVYAGDGALFSMPFDPARPLADSEPTLITNRVHTDTYMLAHFATSHSGRLVFVPGSGPSALRFVWMDSTRTETPLEMAQGPYEEFALSPDGNEIAITVRRSVRSIDVHNISLGTTRTLVASGARPVWSPDGNWIMYWDGDWLLRVPSDGTGVPERILDTDGPAEAWGPGGILAIRRNGGANLIDLGVTHLDAPNEIDWIQATPDNEWGADFSPDGQWMVYMVNHRGTGRRIYVRNMVTGGQPILIADTRGAEEPRWSPDGVRIVYRSCCGWFGVDVSTEPSFVASDPYLLFTGPYENIPGRGHDIGRDGRVLLLRRPAPPVSHEIRVLDNWFVAPSR